MLISVIITVYNKEELLSKCIESIINQSYKKLEIIIINDGSTDNSENIIERYLEDDRIRYYVQPNKGIAFTRNKGIELAKGEYLFFMDGDDELPLDSIHLLANRINNNFDIVIGNYVYRTESYIRKNSALMEKKYSNVSELRSIQLKYDMFLSNGRPLSSVCNKLYRKLFLVSNKIYFENDVLAEDRLFNLYCYCCNPSMIVINKYTYIINQIENSRSRSYNEEFYKLTINLTIKFYEFLIGKNLLEGNRDLLFFNLMNDIEKIHRYIYKYSKSKSIDIKYNTNLIKSNSLFSSILQDGINKKYFSEVQLNNKKWFFIIYVWIINYAPYLILPCLYLSNLVLKVKVKIKSERQRLGN